MSTRYLTNLALALVGGFLLVASQAFTVAIFMWLMLACGIGVIVVAAPGVMIPSRGAAQRGLDYMFSLLGIWTIVASIVFGGLTITWLGFASGAALVALALIGLTAHELSTERVVHSLDVQHAPESVRGREHVSSA
jgi:hypothetical protein